MKDMIKICLLLSSILNLVVSGPAICSTANWFLSFDSEGLSKCSNDTTYIRSLERSIQTSDDIIGLLEYAKCCSAPDKYKSNPSSTIDADWSLVLDSNFEWATCPSGYFLQGLYRSGAPGLLHNIEEGLCAKPFSHPDNYGFCFDQDITLCFDKEGLCGCPDKFYIAGIYRGGCDKLMCIEKLKCCSMA